MFTYHQLNTLEIISIRGARVITVMETIRVTSSGYLRVVRVISTCVSVVATESVESIARV